MDRCWHWLIDDCNSALLTAAQDGHENCLKELLDTGADVNTVDGNNENALIKVTKPRCYISDEILGTFLKKAPEIYVRKPCDKYEQCVDILIKAGADVNFQDGDKSTALIYSCKMGSKRSVSSLIRAGADVNVIDIEYSTPLIIAARKGDCECLNLLVDAGADVNLEPRKKVEACVEEPSGLILGPVECPTALMAAIDYNHMDCVTTLLNAGADVNIRYCDNSTPLIHAVQKGHFEACDDERSES